MKDAEVLLIEDSVGDVLLVRQILTELPVRLRIARDGLQALLILADPAFKPALVILDLNIPDISGQEVLARYHPNNPPVVVFSSSWHEGDKARALAMGARDYVAKPMDLDAYAGALRGMVEKWALRPEKSAVATAGVVSKTVSIQ
jgi:two-component system OmpR family response regulator/two-component system response regulator QseB